MLWRTEIRNGKPTKVPKTIYGNNASSTASLTWSKFDEVRRVFESGGYDGVGFVFTRDAGFSGVDLDHCRDPATGMIDEWAAAIIARLNSYTEVSPSGTGVHVILRGLLPEGVNGKEKKFSGPGYRPEAGIEMYSSLRYLTFTGDKLPEAMSEIERRQEELEKIYTEIFGRIEPRPAATPHFEPVVEGDISARLQEIFKADPKLKADFYTPAALGDRSTHDFHLCASLYEHGLNEAEIEAAMNLSPQEKWRERERAITARAPFFMLWPKRRRTQPAEGSHRARRGLIKMTSRMMR